ncbi:IS1595 family transposase [Endozoicomonadaceae bacterium StTr2]
MRKSRLSKHKQGRLIEHFIAGTTAKNAAVLINVNKTTAAYYFHQLRKLIYDYVEEHTVFSGEVELDESYFGILKRGDCVHTCVIPNAKSSTLLPIIRDKIKPDSVVYTDDFLSYDVLDVSEFKHYRINHSSCFAEEKNHINGIENFWSQAKRHMRKFNGIPREHFPLFLKECEWRFNHSNPKEQICILKQLVRNNLY